jgi:UTP--glucose-1-phosphate uridylyltransferase
MKKKHETIDLPYSNYRIDKQATLDILRKANAESSPEQDMHNQYFIPDTHSPSIAYPSDNISLTLSRKKAVERVISLLPDLAIDHYCRPDGKYDVTFDYKNLRKLGLNLLGITAYGILNGGSATSYIDDKRNSSYLPPLFSILGRTYQENAGYCTDKPKALVPAYVNPDGSPGYSFIELKMRALLLLMLEAEKHTGKKIRIPIFEMRNPSTAHSLESAYKSFSSSPLLKDLIERIGYDVTHVQSETQPLLAALTHKEFGYPRKVFTEAYGKRDALLPLPGGHGQNFSVLRPVYEKLFSNGYYFSTLVNIDNLGNVPDPVHLALTVLNGSQASFEFSRKTPVDVKGGILVEHAASGRFACADIGAAIPVSSVNEAEKRGKEILFNCASGIFDLRYLTKSLDAIIENLPVRISEQDKDAGKYAQAEQITWEVLEMIPRPLILAVDKPKRFLAAKMLSEMLLTSRADEVAPQLLSHDSSYKDFCNLSLAMQRGLHDLLEHTYGMRLSEGKWVPEPLEL